MKQMFAVAKTASISGLGFHQKQSYEILPRKVSKKQYKKISKIAAGQQDTWTMSSMKGRNQRGIRRAEAEAGWEDQQE